MIYVARVMKLAYTDVTRSLLILFIGTLCFGTGQAQPVSLEISVDKSSYAIGEDIWLSIAFVNNSRDVQNVPWPWLLEQRVLCKLTDSNDSTYRYTGLIAESGDTGLSLNAGARIGRLIPLYEAFGRRVWMPSGLLRELPPGQYTLSCNCTWYSFDIDETATASFAIEHPSSEVGSMWQTLISADSRLNARSGAIEKAKRFKEFLDQHPMAPWAPRLLSALDTLDPENRLWYARQLIDRFPQSPWCDFALLTLCMKLSAPEMRIEIETIAQKKANTRVGEIAHAALTGQNGPDTHAEILGALGRSLRDSESEER